MLQETKKKGEIDRFYLDDTTRWMKGKQRGKNVSYHFKGVGNFGHVIRGEPLEEWDAAKKLDVVVDSLKTRPFHHLLENAPIQHPHFGRRHRYENTQKETRQSGGAQINRWKVRITAQERKKRRRAFDCPSIIGRVLNWICESKESSSPSKPGPIVWYITLWGGWNPPNGTNKARNPVTVLVRPEPSNNRTLNDPRRNDINLLVVLHMAYLSFSAKIDFFKK